MSLYEMPSSMSLLVQDGDCVSQLPYVWYYVVVKSRFKHARKKCDFKWAYVFWVPDV